jgi:hypothetical protein
VRLNNSTVNPQGAIALAPITQPGQRQILLEVRDNSGQTVDSAAFELEFVAIPDRTEIIAPPSTAKSPITQPQTLGRSPTKNNPTFDLQNILPPEKPTAEPF